VGWFDPCEATQGKKVQGWNRFIYEEKDSSQIKVRCVEADFGPMRVKLN